MVAVYVMAGAVSTLALYLTLAGVFVVAMVFAPQPVIRSRRVIVGTLIAVACAIGTAAYAANIVDPCTQDIPTWLWWASGCFLP